MSVWGTTPYTPVSRTGNPHSAAATLSCGGRPPYTPRQSDEQSSLRCGHAVLWGATPLHPPSVGRAILTPLRSVAVARPPVSVLAGSFGDAR
ncbi:hypothetical protein GCM10022214_56580 [Actinomadura miaoliensis]|uniref:Uncharacterized protein n=1 Tax=Actinomadura miaoliensis TaxID=430685 RepID=A0ABP7WHR6_9ACTN